MAEECVGWRRGELPRTGFHMVGSGQNCSMGGNFQLCLRMALWLLQLQQLTQPPLALQNDRIPAVSWILPLAFCCLRGKERVFWLPSTAPTSHLVLPQQVGGDCDHVIQFIALSFQDWVFYMLSQQNKYNITSKR